jgi:serine/threonine-protein kinase
MRKLATAAIVAAVLAMVLSGAALWRTRHLSSSKSNPGVSPTNPAAEQVAVPDVTNKNSFEASLNLSAAKLSYRMVKAPSATVAKNFVISEDPAAGTMVPAGTEIQLTTSTGP